LVPGPLMSDSPPSSTPLRPGTRAVMRTRHSFRLAGHIVRFASANGLWWLVPVMVAMALFALALTTTNTVLPVAVYTLF
ncbi:MAG: DUF5989 family protein, partial [Iamia sp.]